MTEVMIKVAMERARVDKSRLALFDHGATHGQHLNLTCTATQLLICIARRSDGRTVSASDPLLAQWLGTTADTAAKARRRLQDAGYLRRDRQAFTITLPACPACEEGQP